MLVHARFARAIRSASSHCTPTSSSLYLILWAVAWIILNWLWRSNLLIEWIMMSGGHWMRHLWLEVGQWWASYASTWHAPLEPRERACFEIVCVCKKVCVCVSGTWCASICLQVLYFTLIFCCCCIFLVFTYCGLTRLCNFIPDKGQYIYIYSRWGNIYIFPYIYFISMWKFVLTFSCAIAHVLYR